MTTNFNSPGVYIREESDLPAPIVGVATSITAFVGRAVRGPVNQATAIASDAEFHQTFGGLQHDYPMSYAVRDYFQNGGRQAVIVRLFNPGRVPATESQMTAVAATDVGLILMASSPGRCGNKLGYLCDTVGIAANNSSEFNLRIYETGDDGQPILQEQFARVSCDGLSNQRIDHVLLASSRCVRARIVGATIPECMTSIPIGADLIACLKPLAGGDDGDRTLTAAQYAGDEELSTGIHALDGVDLFNILCIPPNNRDTEITGATWLRALAYCFGRRAFLLVDSPWSWETAQETISPALKNDPRGQIDNLLKVPEATNAALYFPRLVQPDPLQNDRSDQFAPCGAIAGIMARTDASRGVWAAPAGVNASLAGVQALSVPINDADNGSLNSAGINSLRTFTPYGPVVWGARTLRGDDQLASEYRYLQIRRTVLYIEESISRGTQWAVFEPNNERLWASLRQTISIFLQNLFLQGAFVGTTPREAYFVTCDATTTTSDDISRGNVNVLVGVAMLSPAEFIVLNFSVLAAGA